MSLADSRACPEDNPTAQSLKKSGDENVKRLNGLTGSAFDKAYMDHEVAYHQQVIDAVDKTLIPGATNAELKALLVKCDRLSSRTSSTPRAWQAP